MMARGPLMAALMMCLCSSASGLASPTRLGVTPTTNVAPQGMVRVDALLVSSGLVSNRATAKKLLEQGLVTTKSGKVVKKASKMLSEDATLHVNEPAPEEAVDASSIDDSDSKGSDSKGIGVGSLQADYSALLDELGRDATTFVPKPSRPQTSAARTALRQAGVRAARGPDVEEALPAVAKPSLRKGTGNHHAARRFSKKNKRGTAV